MKNIMISMNRFFIILFLFSLVSCIKDDEKTMISQESMEWFYQGDIGDIFQLENTNGISTSYLLKESRGSNLESGHTIYGLDEDLTDIDEYLQSFSSTYNINFSLHVSSNYYPFGDRFVFTLDDVVFVVDLKFEKLIEVGFKQIHQKFLIVGEDEYEEETPISSTIQFLDSYEVNGQIYSDIIHFRLNDFSNLYNDFTIRDIYIAKHIGILSYTLNNELTYFRSS